MKHIRSPNLRVQAEATTREDGEDLPKETPWPDPNPQHHLTEPASKLLITPTRKTAPKAGNLQLTLCKSRKILCIVISPQLAMFKSLNCDEIIRIATPTWTGPMLTAIRNLLGLFMYLLSDAHFRLYVNLSEEEMSCSASLSPSSWNRAHRSCLVNVS